MSYADTHTFEVCKYKGKRFDLGVKTSDVGKFVYFNDLARTLFSTPPHIMGHITVESVIEDCVVIVSL